MKNKKGFTLIELLAVIVILGLLMAIAIPSVTRYITQSRKNTMTTTISNYISSISNEVSDLEYKFTKSNTIYAVPIECIAVERGGKNPFGQWHQANDKYWAYVLIQYDYANSTYRYGFTYKDSAGYGLYPISQTKFKEINKHIKTGLNLQRPTTGKVTSLTSLENWSNSGFEINSSTNLNVLISEKEGIKGNGLTTCTLYQKADNYNDVEAEKDRVEASKKVYALILDNSEDAVDKYPMIFIKTLNEPKVNETYVTDEYGELPIIAVYTDFIDQKYQFNYVDSSNTPWIDKAPMVTSVHVIDEIKPISTSAWFVKFEKTEFLNLRNLDLSEVTDMSFMFFAAGSAVGVESFKIVGLENWDTSNVTNMMGVFASSGAYVKSWSIGDITGWDVSKVTTTYGMFASTAYRVSEWNINLRGWNLASLEDMGNMFAHAARQGEKIRITGLDTWDTSNVKSMNSVFYFTGYEASYKLDVSNWNVTNVTDYNKFSYHVESKIVSPKFK